MTTIMEIGNLGVGFRPQIVINSTRKWRCKQFLGQKMQNKKSFLLVCSVASKVCSFSEEENGLIEALIGIQGRGRAASPQQLQEVERAVKVLEGSEGIPEPTSSSLIEGRWQLMFTTRPGSASPIQVRRYTFCLLCFQLSTFFWCVDWLESLNEEMMVNIHFVDILKIDTRTFVGVDSFSVFQEVFLRTNDQRVSNIVKFSEAIGELKVEALATIKDGKRILFQFDRAAFSFKFLPFKVPYPVPFRLLGDEAKGWLDTTYLSPSGNLRISRGNKGTTFVLQRETEPRQKLLSSISTGTRVEKAIDEFISLNQNVANPELELLEGEWQMIWSSQVETDSWLENAGNGLMGNQIVKPDGQLKFLVGILFGIRKSGSNTYDVIMDDGAILAGMYGIPVEMESKFTIEILYTDDKIRISRGYNKILFVHVRVDGPKKKS
ncbi:hypothetical protein H5410_000239 [Solanum commersonii]|uniref:Plastid lipid-associated protein/fibrillin conserved domain-containing protein n=1 Tax=Solanum commersonii TaxID=4109 RepID=A0A9J6AW90_SOLCO|nr:hypothetical protein H5410_000239 [Solanum commersonii]